MKVPRTPPDSSKGLQVLFATPDAASRVFASGAYSPTVGDRYVHWDNLRFLAPPRGITHEEWWAAIKLARRASYRPLPLVDTSGAPFQVGMPDPLLRQLSEVDRNLSGRVAVPDPLTQPGTRDRYLVSALIEEAITSSQLEGAATTRKVASEMLRTGRRPRSRDERMIANNFEAMRFVREHMKAPLTPDLVCEVHRIATEGTLEDPADAGRLRSSDDIRVVEPIHGVELHAPPAFRELPGRLKRLCEFANEEAPSYFVHPVVRALLLHFWLAYDHPFVDGNGRTARALFYWSMLHSDYWLIEYISVSSILKKAPAKYSLAYLHSETDENDATYFLLYQVRVLRRAITSLHESVRSKIEAMRSTQALLKQSQWFNYRQLALLSHALRKPDAQYTATSHANSHQVTRQTARTDLQEMSNLGLLQEIEVRQGYAYSPAPDLEEKLVEFGKKRRSEATVARPRTGRKD